MQVEYDAAVAEFDAASEDLARAVARLEAARERWQATPRKVNGRTVARVEGKWVVLP